MKEKKIGRVIILIAFIVIICSSKGIWFFAEKFMDSTNYENRQMAAQPRLTLDNYGTFAQEYTSYFNDNLQFRNDLISWNSAIDYFCFGKSSHDDVIVGKENWLFFSSVDDGDSIRSYLGEDLYSEEELQAMAQNCIEQRDFLREQGKEFVIYIAPNKERIYYEYMPGYYGEPAEMYGTLQIYNYLKENTDLTVVYPYAELMEAKGKLEQNIYQKTDTHWNYLGAYVGASALLSELGIELPPIYSSEITIVDNGESSGDLAKMLNLKKQLKFADREYTVEGYPLHNVEQVEYDWGGMWSFRATGADPRTIYVIRDSFATHMAEYIGSQFTESYLRHMNTYTYNDLAKCDPDIVVYETVERRAGERLGVFSIQ